MIRENWKTFWLEAVTWQGSISPSVIGQVLLFGLLSGMIALASWLAETCVGCHLGLEVAPFEFAGAALGLLLVLRTNAGYDRWWEGRRLWGGIVNQSRNLAISGLAYGPADPAWRKRFVELVALFPFIARSSLRGEEPEPEFLKTLGVEHLPLVDRPRHYPSYWALKVADLLHETCAKNELDRFAFIQIDTQRASLIDHIGGCERILKTPLAKAYAIKVRRFILLFLLILPFALLHRMDSDFLVPIVTMMVAYPLLSLDMIAVELQNPFSKQNLSHLPLDDIARTIEGNLHEVLSVKNGSPEAAYSD